MRPFDDDSDSAVEELLGRAYARRVELDTAARHLWAIDRAAQAARRRHRTLRRRRAVVSTLTSVMLLASSGVAVGASSEALPGDVLYGLKRGTERVRLVLAVRPEAAAEAWLTIAHVRWDEAKRAAEARPEVVPALLKDTLQALEAAESGGGVIAERALVLRTQVTADSGQVALGGSPDRPDGARLGGPRTGQPAERERSWDAAPPVAGKKSTSLLDGEAAKEAADGSAAPAVAGPPTPSSPSSSPRDADPVPAGPGGAGKPVPPPDASGPVEPAAPEPARQPADVAPDATDGDPGAGAPGNPDPGEQVPDQGPDEGEPVADEPAVEHPDEGSPTPSGQLHEWPYRTSPRWGGPTHTKEP